VTPATARGWASVPGSSAQRAALAERFVDPIDCRYRWRIGDFGLRRNEQRVRVATVLGGLVLSGCAREQEPFFCPDVGEGELIITEIRGSQEGPDTWGQWIELHNPTDRDLDLFGLRVSMRPLDGDEPDVILVRAEGIALPAGGYAVLGRFDDDARPEHVDYGFQVDLESSLLPASQVTVTACGVITDRVLYRRLPGLGSLSLDGATAPDAEFNDDETVWCDDATEPSPDGPQTELGVPGTPGEANRPCG
jgi:hypothetical protein